MSDLGFRQPVLLYLPGVVAMEIRGPPEGSSPWHLILIMPEPTCESFVSCMILWVVAAERALDASTADHYLNFASRLSILSSEITFYMYCGCSPNHSQKIRQKIHHWQFTTKGRSRLLWMLLQTTWRDSRMALCRVLGWWTSGRFLSRTIGIHVLVISSSFILNQKGCFLWGSFLMLDHELAKEDTVARLPMDKGWMWFVAQFRYVHDIMLKYQFSIHTWSVWTAHHQVHSFSF